tara:strand:- start:761 stop:1030 length:270 start_codon:yes stop_codon:yes gene_type:complete
MTRENQLDDILFNLIVLASKIPTADVEVSIAEIAVLSQLPISAQSHLVLAGTEYINAGLYEEFTALYGKFLLVNGKESLAIELNNRAAL